MFHIGKKFWWEVDKPTDLKEYIGRHVRVTGDDHKERVVEIERIVGSLVYPSKFEITAKDQQYLISMLDFYGQINGEKFSKEDIEAFDDTQLEVREAKRTLWRPGSYNVPWRNPKQRH